MIWALLFIAAYIFVAYKSFRVYLRWSVEDWPNLEIGVGEIVWGILFAAFWPGFMPLVALMMGKIHLTPKKHAAKIDTYLRKTFNLPPKEN